MKYIGRYGEFLVLTKLLEQELEAYLAVKTNQDDYDITVILNNNSVVRIQVKSTDLNNKGTNNAIGRVEKNYDFLIIVIINNSSRGLYILSREEAIAAKGKSKHLGVSYKKKGVSFVKQSISCHENKWEKIIDKSVS